jgi:hypothetical protein
VSQVVDSEVFIVSQVVDSEVLIISQSGLPGDANGAAANDKIPNTLRFGQSSFWEPAVF